MLYFSLSRYSYIRCTDHFVYIANQSTGRQIIYDASCADFANALTHTPQLFDTVVSNLAANYDDVDFNEIHADFESFLYNLSKEGFIILAKTATQVTSLNDEQIVYSMEIPQITDLTIEITNRCNERCIHCYLPNNIKDNGVSLDLNTIKSLIDEFVEMGGKTITLTGGEVLLHNNLSDLLYYIHDKQLQIFIYSNLIALSEKNIQDLININTSLVQVSLYGVTPFVHDTITRRKGSCISSLKAIESLKKAGIKLRIACSVLRENKDDVINVLKYSKSNDIPLELELNITPREDRSRDNLEHRLSIDEMENFLLELMNYDKDYTINLLHRHKHVYDENFNLAEYLSYPICTAGHYGLYINAEGKVSTCPNLQGIEVDTINKSSLKSIWYENEKIMSFRKTTEVSSPNCINCEASDYCFRCFAMNYTETGSIKHYPNYVCEMAFLAKRIVESNIK